MLEIDGAPTAEDLQGVTPPRERFEKGPVAIFECFRKIPCNPCYDACKFGAVLPFEDINDVPRVDWDKCNGCAVCVAKCPGLAIFVIDETYSPNQALLKLPYEFYPLPEKGRVVSLLDRVGQVVGTGSVVRTVSSSDKTATPVVWVTVPKALSMTVRSIKPEAQRG